MRNKERSVDSTQLRVILIRKNTINNKCNFYSFVKKQYIGYFSVGYLFIQEVKRKQDLTSDPSANTEHNYIYVTRVPPAISRK